MGPGFIIERSEDSVLVRYQGSSDEPKDATAVDRYAATLKAAGYKVKIETPDANDHSNRIVHAAPSRKPNWLVSTVLESAAETIIESQEIRQALDQIQVNAETLRDLIADSIDDILFALSPSVTFVESVGWHQLPGMHPFRRFVLALAALMSISGAGACIAIFFGWIPLVVTFGGAGLAVLLAAIKLAPQYREFPEPLEYEWDELGRKVIGPFLREQINQMLDKDGPPLHLRVTTAPGLAELVDREQVVATHAVTRLGQLSREMLSGTLGVSGPRGAGKTTLLRYFCDTSLERRIASEDIFISYLRVFLSAPVDYAPREFILHLFGKLCQAILNTIHMSPNASLPEVGDGRAKRVILDVIPVIVMAAGITIILWATVTRPAHLLTVTPFWTYVAIGAILFAIGVGASITRRPHYDRFLTEKDSVVDDARKWLKRIRYLEAFTTGYSGELRVPAGIRLGATTTRQLTEIQLTLPEIVEEFREFAARTALWWRSRRALRIFDQERLAAEGRIVIGIDELDKIDSSESAERFLNDIKAIFGIPHCLYLVSVSDEALTAFERRAFVARTVFDSTFDEIVRVGFLDFGAAKNLLRSRVAGLPDPVIALCYAISGGLSRDLIRAVRDLFELREHGLTHVTDLATGMIAREVDKLKRTFLRSISSDESWPGQSDLISNLLGDNWPGTSSKAMLDSIERGLGRLSALREMNSALYFYATVADVFGSTLDATVAALSSGHQAGTCDIEQIAQARNALSENPEIAWELITRFRIARNLTQVTCPWR